MRLSQVGGLSGPPFAQSRLFRMVGTRKEISNEEVRSDYRVGHLNGRRSDARRMRSHRLGREDLDQWSQRHQDDGAKDCSASGWLDQQLDFVGKTHEQSVIWNLPAKRFCRRCCEVK